MSVLGFANRKMMATMEMMPTHSPGVKRVFSHTVERRVAISGSAAIKIAERTGPMSTNPWKNRGKGIRAPNSTMVARAR